MFGQINLIFVHAMEKLFGQRDFNPHPEQNLSRTLMMMINFHLFCAYLNTRLANKRVQFLVIPTRAFDVLFHHYCLIVGTFFLHFIAQSELLQRKTRSYIRLGIYLPMSQMTPVHP